MAITIMTMEQKHYDAEASFSNVAIQGRA